MSDGGQKLSDCGCCEGRRALTPAPLVNRPGLSQLVYRVGTHATFKASLQASLARTPAFRQRLTTRDDDDPALALLDGWSTVADVLTFYQERIANEGFLRTAGERRSILELARSIGYELNPGVAASTYLAFTLEQIPEVTPPNGAARPVPGLPGSVTLTQGTKVQSTPAQGQQAQIFETSADLEARAEWNTLRPRTGEPQSLQTRADEIYLQGADTRLEPGDALLIVGDERERWPGSENWDLRLVQSVTIDHARGVTVVTWKDILGHEAPPVRPATHPRVYVFRQRAALFGHNAPDWRAMPYIVKRAYDKDVEENKPNTWGKDWPSDKFRNTGADQGLVELDAAYPKIRPRSWLALVKPTYAELYRTVEVMIDGRADFTLSGKVTRIKLDTREHLSWFGLREAVVFAQSEELRLAEQPILTPVFGNRIVLADRVTDLEPGRALFVSGKRVERVTPAKRSHVVRRGRTVVERRDTALYLTSLDGKSRVELKAGDELEVLAPPVIDARGALSWRLRTAGGLVGIVITDIDDLVPLAPGPDAETIHELAFLKAISDDGSGSTLVLQAALANAYDRATVLINANVVTATHGDTKREIVGSGNAARAFQAFILKQTPLTYVSASTATGAASSLALRVNDVLVDAASTLYGQGPNDLVYTTRLADDGKATVQFGDGVTGARLPSGADNIVASYRVGTGLAGLVEAGQLNVLMSQALGVKEVVNPLAATGAADPETRDEARANAPLTVLTLARIVSLQDYEDFARAFAGLGKARAAWLWDGETRFVHITVAAANGDAVDKSSVLYQNLSQAIDAAREPTQGVRIDSYAPRSFHIEARLRVKDGYQKETVFEAVTAALNEAFAFAQRAFAQNVTKSSVLTLIQGVDGVQAVDLDRLYLHGDRSATNTLLVARPARWDTTTVPPTLRPAELLTVDPAGITLGDL